MRLQLGFHCVVNRSQKNIDEGMSRVDLWNKEKKIFSSERLRSLPEDYWGTRRLMEKIAKIQEDRVDACLPKIREAVRQKTVALRNQLRDLPEQTETEADQFRVFNTTLNDIKSDLERRVRAEFMSTEEADRELTIAPRVAGMIQEFRQELLSSNPSWLGEQMITEVEDTVATFVRGYTVDNLTGPQVFVNLIKRVFVEEGLLKDAVGDLVSTVAEHLRTVVQHVVSMHANSSAVLANRLSVKAEDCVDSLMAQARDVCETMAEAQQVTSTTHGEYMVRLTQFRKSWLHQKADSMKKTIAEALMGTKAFDEQELPPEFVEVVQKAQYEPDKLAVLEICASLHVYTGFLIEGFVEMAAKMVKFKMVEQLSKKLEQKWREELGGSNLQELFPKDNVILLRRQDLQHKMATLEDFKAVKHVAVHSDLACCTHVVRCGTSTSDTHPCHVS